MEHLAAEADDRGVFFIQTRERAVVSNDVDQLGVESSLETDGLVPVPLKVVVGFAAGDQNREFTRVRIERSARHGGVMEIMQGLRDARVIGSEGERTAQDVILTGPGRVSKIFWPFASISDFFKYGRRARDWGSRSAGSFD